MAKNSGQLIFGVIVSLLLMALIVYLATSKTPAKVLPLIFMLAPLVFIITFLNTDIALIILIFSMLLSPELKLAEVPARAVVVRIDDILLFVVFFSWLAKMAIKKELGFLRHTPLNPVIVVYISVCIFSTGLGILNGNVKVLKSFFYILKYIEYFMLYFLVTNSIRDKKQMKTFIIAFLTTCMLTCSYALATVGPSGRATAPFEGAEAEPNTLGGYLILLFAVTAGLFLYSSSRRWKFFCGALACLIFLALLQTLSRSSYLAFIPMYLTLILLTRKSRMLLIVIFIAGIILTPVMMPGRVVKRVENTFVFGTEYRPFGKKVVLDESASARIETWGWILKEWKERPFLGHGVSGLGIIDVQYLLVLGETGIIGFWIFSLMLMIIFKNAFWAYGTLKDDWDIGLTLGFLAGFIGLLVHSFGAATFIIVRIMEPFWFLAAVVLMLPEVGNLPEEIQAKP